ncbi:threonine--tRNA ligase [Rugosimonospora acidiphila]|uniref:Threonine--tRNA ligase n=1 Tax=Rugosimonospora acidiphila TaxID=556531 RepID=A0ABP9RRV4_9ACTN
MNDHRRLGRELELFCSDPLIGAGLPIWLPDGAAARHAVEEYLRRQESAAGYQHVYSPPMGRRELYEISGHWAHFAEDMFPPMRDGGEELVLRPSLCPHHALVYRARQRSFRDLPMRVAEIGGMYRAERSGVLGGLARVRAISLNDAHIFSPLELAGEEIARVLAMMRRVHAALGLVPARVRLSLRGPDRQYAGSAEQWELAEGILRDALAGSSYVEAPGEAAFYGPKVDVQIVDPAGRESTLATVQLDLHQPARFDLSYVDSSGSAARPVMVHRSLVGSLERLFGHLIEVHAGAFPAWYAPVQVAVLPVGANEASHASRFARECSAAGLRVNLAVDGSLGARVRDARRVPYLAVIGSREAGSGEVSLRTRPPRGVPAAAGPAPKVAPAGEAVRMLVEACAAP